MAKGLDLETFKKWVQEQRHSEKYRSLGFLSVTDLYRSIFPNNEPYNKRTYYGRKMNNHFKTWLREVWTPFLKSRREELEVFLTNFTLGQEGIVNTFSIKKDKLDNRGEK